VKREKTGRDMLYYLGKRRTRQNYKKQFELANLSLIYHEELWDLRRERFKGEVQT